VEVGAEVVAKLLDDRCRLVFPQQPVVDKNAGQLAADRPREERGNDRRINAAGKSADHAVVAYAAAQIGDHGLGEVLEPPGPRAAAGGGEEVPQDRPAGRGVGDLRMELQSEDRERHMADRGQGTGCGAGERAEVGGHPVHLVPVAHPDLGAGWHAREEFVFLEHLARRPAVFAGLRPPDLTAEGVAGQLHAVADAEHRNAESKNRRVAPWRARLVDARRPAGEDDALGVERTDAVGGHVVPDDLAIDMLLANPPSDELRVLRAEVEHEHPLRLLGGSAGRWRSVARREGGGHGRLDGGETESPTV